MSKISDYLDKVRKTQEEENLKVQTVADFAVQLNKSPVHLLELLTLSGVNKTSTSDSLSDSDKQKLLSFLQKEHSPKSKRKKIKITYVPEVDRLLKALEENGNGAEMACLEYFADDVVWGQKIPPNMQKIFNLILAKAVISGSLPEMKLGRPKDQELEDLGLKAANRYWSLKDSGVSYADAVRQVALEIHKDERHVMRLIAKHKKSVGLTFEERESKRAFDLIIEKTFSVIANNQLLIGESIIDLPTHPELETSDYLDHLDEQIAKTIRAK